MARAGRLAVGAAAVLAIGAGVAAATGFGLPDGEAASPPHSDLPPATAKVTRQTLVDRQSETGDLGYGDAVAVSGRVPGTVTWVPAVDTVVHRGEPLYKVDDTSVVLLYGSLPAYRALTLNAKGADVKEFEQNLWALGYRGFTVDDTYSSSTVDAVKKWQKALGLPQTGTVDLGRVVYAPGQVRVAEQKAATGDPASGAVLTYTGTARVVTVELDVADARLAAPGVAVTVKLPDGKSVPGKVTSTKTVIKPAEGNNPATTKLDVYVSIDDAPSLDQATVDVGFTASQRDNVLTVPVAALLALAEGGYGVQVVDGGSTRIVAVQTGMFADGRVEVTGDGLTAGTVVGMPS
jgi:peptidoglycan hydrolase-like protein with peptidoglycan-binding domain